MTTASLLLGIWSIGPTEMMVVVVVAFLLYGGELPKVARQWAKTFGELRRHLSTLQREFNNVVYADPEPVRKLEYYPEFRDAKITEVVAHPDDPSSFASPSKDGSNEAPSAPSESPASADASSDRTASDVAATDVERSTNLKGSSPSAAV